MIDKLRETILDLAMKIEATFDKYCEQLETIKSDPDLVKDKKRQMEWEAWEEAKEAADNLYAQGLKEIAEVQDITKKQLSLVLEKEDSSDSDPSYRAKVENLLEELQTSLIADGPFEYIKHLGQLLESEGNTARLAAARATLPMLKKSLFEELYSRETNGAVNPWADEKAIASENSDLVKAELAELARKFNSVLKPEAGKKYEDELNAVKEIEIEITSAQGRTSRLLDKRKPTGPEPGSPWDPAHLEKAGLQGLF